MNRQMVTIAAISMLTAAAAHADQGMWMPWQTQQLAETLKAQGLQLDPAVLAGKHVYDTRGIWPGYRAVRPEDVILSLRAAS